MFTKLGVAGVHVAGCAKARLFVPEARRTKLASVMSNVAEKAVICVPLVMVKLPLSVNRPGIGPVANPTASKVNVAVPGELQLPVGPTISTPLLITTPSPLSEAAATAGCWAALIASVISRRNAGKRARRRMASPPWGDQQIDSAHHAMARGPGRHCWLL